MNHINFDSRCCRLVKWLTMTRPTSSTILHIDFLAKARCRPDVINTTSTPPVHPSIVKYSQNGASSLLRRWHLIHWIPWPRGVACAGSISNVCHLRAALSFNPDRSFPTSVHLRQWRAGIDVEHRLLPPGETGESRWDEGVDVRNSGQCPAGSRVVPGIDLTMIDTGCSAGRLVCGMGVWRGEVRRMEREILDAFGSGHDGGSGSVGNVVDGST